MFMLRCESCVSLIISLHNAALIQSSEVLHSPKPKEITRSLPIICEIMASSLPWLCSRAVYLANSTLRFLCVRKRSLTTNTTCFIIYSRLPLLLSLSDPWVIIDFPLPFMIYTHPMCAYQATPFIYSSKLLID